MDGLIVCGYKTTGGVMDCMKWVEIDKENLPNGIVLAANFNPDTDDYKLKFLGILTLWDDDNVTCGLGYRSIDNVTHYIDVDKFDLEEK